MRRYRHTLRGRAGARGAVAKPRLFADAPVGVLAAELDMLYRALARTRADDDKRAEAAALRCIAAVEAELLARDENECR